MIAFWKYDLFPFCLSAEVNEFNSATGLVKVKGYGNSTFRPNVILPDEQGAIIAQKLRELETSYDIDKARLHVQYVAELKSVLPFPLGE